MKHTHFFEQLRSLSDAIFAENKKIGRQLVETALDPATFKNFEVYRHNFIYTLLRTLEAQYPAVLKELGKNNFRFWIIFPASFEQT